MRRRIQVSEARAKLSNLLKQIHENPDIIYEITVNSMVLGELRAPDAMQFRLKPGKALTDAMEMVGQPETSMPESTSIARDHDSYLYERK